MSVSEISSKLYTDSRPDVAAEKSESSGFDAIVESAVQKKASAPACSACVRITEPVTVPATEEPVASVAGSEVAEPAAEKTEATASQAVAPAEDEEVTRSAMYSFTMYVRISGDFAGLQNSFADGFKAATTSFVKALQSDSSFGVDALDNYLGQAESASGNGMQSARTFLDEMLTAADKGLKMITASLKSSAWMSGLNLNGSSSSSSSLSSLSSMFASSSSSSSSSSSMFSSSSALDMAKLQLQAALESSAGKSSDNLSAATGSAEMVDYGSGYKLAKLKGDALVKVDESGNSDSLPAATKTADDSKAVAASPAITRRNLLLDRFLQLIDSLSSNLESGSQIVRAGFSFAIDNGIISDNREVENANEAEANRDDASTGAVVKPDGETEETVA
ncbi:MAG TPA: hypothetical protein PLM07_03530 [Candidatus Rifleibacterium sp.]|nr:hypothetical protein [Candidatus Rifleibacterium sp.]HPT44955.1 hypothetical protein [Candidatus Rifleibacterium sp.]